MYLHHEGIINGDHLFHDRLTREVQIKMFLTTGSQKYPSYNVDVIYL